MQLIFDIHSIIAWKIIRLTKLRKKKRQHAIRNVHELVFQSDISEQIGHRLFVVNSTYGFRNENGYIHSFDFVALHLLDFMRNGVGDNHFVNRRIFDQPGSVGAQEAVGSQHVDLICTALFENFGGSHKRCHIVDHVVLKWFFF